ncbi:MAG: hypothetical protein ABIH65_01895 [Nanoarchaeota archaeon]
MNIKGFFSNIPVLPLSAIIIYLLIGLLIGLNIIPPRSEIVILLENLYQRYGLIALFLSALLEGIVYLGFYFAGGTIILFVVLFSDGKFLSFLNISIVVAVALIIASFINYFFGFYVIKKNLKKSRNISEKNKISKGLLFSALHPNSLAFYFFNLGLKKESIWKILFVPLIMIPYGFLLACIFYFIKPFIENNIKNSPLMITVLLSWFTIAFIIKNKHILNKKKK